MTRNLPRPLRHLPRLLAGTALVLGSLNALTLAAVEVKGARFDDTYQLANQSLSLNGAGIRVKIIVDVYAAALYVPHRGHDANNVLAQNGPKSMQIVLLRDLTGEDFADAMVKGFTKNNSSVDLARFQSKIDDIRNLMMGFGKVRKGAVIHIDFTPGTGTTVTVDGIRRGQEVAGDEFFTALLRIWLGNAPVDSDLKEALLGAK
jgi:hypothetical protein